MSADLVGLPAQSVPLATDLFYLKTYQGTGGGGWIPYSTFVGAGFASSALALDATSGHQYLPTCAGTPTGVPTARAGRVGCVYDTTANKLWIYNGAWRSVTLS